MTEGTNSPKGKTVRERAEQFIKDSGGVFPADRGVVVKYLESTINSAVREECQALVEALETLKSKWDLSKDANTTISYKIVDKALSGHRKRMEKL